MVSRIYVEKKPGFDVEARALAHELRTILGIEGLEALRLINRYDVEGITEELFAACVPTVFSEPQVDIATEELPVSADAPGTVVFAVEFLPGQFDQRADSASECIQLISQGERPAVRSAKVYVLEGALSEADVEAVKRYVINPVEAREASLEPRATLKQETPEPEPVEVLDGFLDLDQEGLAAFIEERGLAMDLADITFCQEYFAGEKRAPTITEIKVIDTYWSDHCRHTTFGTVLDDVAIDDETVQKAFDAYLAMRHELGRDEKPVCLMRTRTGSSSSRTRPTTTPPRSSPSAARPPASAAPSATRSPAAATSTRPCASPALPTPRSPCPRPWRASCRSASS